MPVDGTDDYNLLFCWFVGFSIDDRVWDHSTFTRNRDRLLEGDIARRFFARVLGQAERAGLLSREHFSVDGTLIGALTSFKSYRPKDEGDPPGGGGRNPDVDFQLRHQGLCGCTALRQRDTACRTEHEPPFIGHRWDAQSGDGGMSMAELQGFGVPGNRRIGPELANFRPEGRSHCASFAAGCQKGPFSRVIFNGLLEIVR